jgi:hypothetical protein
VNGKAQALNTPSSQQQTSIQKTLFSNYACHIFQFKYKTEQITRAIYTNLYHSNARITNSNLARRRKVHRIFCRRNEELHGARHHLSVSSIDVVRSPATLHTSAFFCVVLSQYKIEMGDTDRTCSTWNTKNAYEIRFGTINGWDRQKA